MKTCVAQRHMHYFTWRSKLWRCSLYGLFRHPLFNYSASPPPPCWKCEHVLSLAHAEISHWRVSPRLRQSLCAAFNLADRYLFTEIHKDAGYQHISSTGPQETAVHPFAATLCVTPRRENSRGIRLRIIQSSISNPLSSVHAHRLRAISSFCTDLCSEFQCCMF